MKKHIVYIEGACKPRIVKIICTDCMEILFNKMWETLNAQNVTHVALMLYYDITSYFITLHRCTQWNMVTTFVQKEIPL